MCDAEIIDLASDDEELPVQTNGFCKEKVEEKKTGTKEISVKSHGDKRRAADNHAARNIKRIKPVLLSCDSSKPSTSTSDNLHPNSLLFDKYTSMCAKKDKSNDMEIILKRLFKTYNAAHSGYKESAEFKKLLLDQLDGCDLPSFQIYVSIKYVRDELKFNKKQPIIESTFVCQPSTSKEGNSTDKSVDTSGGKPAEDGEHESVKREELTTIKEEDHDSDDSLYGFNEDRKRKIRKLEKLMRALNKAIGELEQREVKWESEKEEDSAYIKMDRYQNRIVKVYSKICELRKKSADADRPIKRKVSFEGSGYPDVDRYVEKMYNRSRKFPDFHDVLDIVKEVKKDEKLPPDKLHRIAETVFKKFGKLLKLVRQRDDYDIMCSYIPSGHDPALDNKELEEKLKENFKQFEKKEEEVINSFVEKEVEHCLEPEEVNDSGQDEDENEEAEDYDDNIAGKINNGSDSETNFEHSDDDVGGNKLVKKRKTVCRIDSDDSSSDRERKTVSDTLKTENKDLNFNTKNKDDSVKPKTGSNGSDGCNSVLDQLVTFSGDEGSNQSHIDADLFSVPPHEIAFSDCGNENKPVLKVKTVSDLNKAKETPFLNADRVDSVVEMPADKGSSSHSSSKTTDEFPVSKTIDINSERKENFSKKSGGDALSDDDCVIEEVKVRKSSAFKIEKIDVNNIFNESASDIFKVCSKMASSDVKRIEINEILNKTASDFFKGVKKRDTDPSRDVDIVYDGKCDDDDDEIRVLTPQKKIKRSNSSVDQDSDSSVIKIQNKIILSLHQPTISDIVKPLATSTPEKKLPKVFNKTNIQGPMLKKLLQTELPSFQFKPSTSNDRGFTQTARVIVDGKRAEFVSKNNAKKVISKGNTKIFTKGVKNNKVVDSNEVITLD